MPGDGERIYGRRPVQILEGVLEGDAAIDANGVIEIVIGPVPLGVQWRLDVIAVTCTSGAATRATIFVGRQGTAADLNKALNKRGSTALGNDDVLDDPANGILVPEAHSVLVRWTNPDAGSRGQVAMQYRVEALQGFDEPAYISILPTAPATESPDMAIDPEPEDVIAE